MTPPAARKAAEPKADAPPVHQSLAAALAAFQSDMPTVHKGKTATVPTKGGGSYRYTYADLADVAQAAHPILARHGLAFTATPKRTTQGDYELQGRLIHTSGQRVKGSLPLFGRTAQELGSSITYARRYLLGCLTGIVTDDDEDGNVAQGASRTTRDTAAEEARAAEDAREAKAAERARLIATATATPEVAQALADDAVGYADTIHDPIARREHLLATWNAAAEAGALGCMVPVPEPWRVFANGAESVTLHDLISGAAGANLPPSTPAPQADDTTQETPGE